MKIFDPYSIGLTISKVTGFEAKLRCPFHYDTTPSASFNMMNGLFHCFGCGYSANAFFLAKEFGGEINKVDSSLITVERDEREWRQLIYSQSAIKSKYLKSRQVTEQQIKKFQILRHKGGILFPIFDKKGVLVGIQERKLKEQPRYILHGERTPVWPMSNLKYEHVLLVEGVFGVLRADLFGFHAVCTMGASAIPQAAKVLSGHNVRIIFDDDIPGYLGAYSFMRLHKNSTVCLPGGEVDEADFGSLAFMASKLQFANIIQFALENNNLPLINSIKQKEARYGSLNKNWQPRFATRKIG